MAFRTSLLALLPASTSPAGFFSTVTKLRSNHPSCKMLVFCPNISNLTEVVNAKLWSVIWPSDSYLAHYFRQAKVLVYASMEGRVAPFCSLTWRKKGSRWHQWKTWLRSMGCKSPLPPLTVLCAAAGRRTWLRRPNIRSPWSIGGTDFSMSTRFERLLAYWPITLHIHF